MSNPYFKRRRRLVQDKDQLQSIVDGYDSIQLNANTTITGNLIISGSISAGSIAHTLNDISDVVITSATTNDVLSYNGSDWINSTSLTLTQLTNSKYIYATNLLIGDSNTGGSLTSGADNILIGDAVAQNISTHSNNVMIGKSTGNAGTNLYNNVIIGSLAGSLGNSFASNVLIGYNCFPNCTGNANVVIGANTCGSLTNDGSNTVVGSSAMSTCLPGSHDCCVFGANSLAGTGGVNVRCNCFGSLVMSNATDADDNCFFGTQIADSIVNSAHQNVAMGNYAMQKITTLANCVAIGHLSLNTATDGASNSTAIGYKALFTSNALNNTAVGYQSLYTTSTGRDNIAIGPNSMYYNADGGYNVSIGSGSLVQCVSGYDNVAIGANSLNVSLANNLVAIGSSAMVTNTTGVRCVAVGKSALRLNLDTNDNTAVGYEAGLNNVANANTFIGSSSGYANTTGFNNVSMGWESLRINSTGSSSVAIGTQSLRNNTANYTTGVGFQSLYTNSTGEQNTAFGFKALSLNQTNSYNTGVGYQCLVQSVSDSNSAVGDQALYTLTSGNNNTAVGRKSLFLTTGSQNTALGSLAGDDLTTEDNCLLLGYNSKIGSYGSNSIVLGNASHTNIYTNATLNIDNISEFSTDNGILMDGTRMKDNCFKLTQTASPVAYESGYTILYAKNDDTLHFIDGSNNERTLLSDALTTYTFSSISTDAITEKTGDNGVLIDGTRMKDSCLKMTQVASGITYESGYSVLYAKNDDTLHYINGSNEDITLATTDDLPASAIYGMLSYQNSTGTNITITTGGTYYDITPSMTTIKSEGLTIDSNYKFKIVTAGTYKITSHISGITTTGTIGLYGIGLNSNVYSYSCNYMESDDKEFDASVVYIVDLTTDNLITSMCSTNSDGDTFTIKSVLMTIEKV